MKINNHDLRNIELDDLEEIIKNLSGTVEFVSFIILQLLKIITKILTKIVSRYFSKGLSNELESNYSHEYSTLPSMSSLSSFNLNPIHREQKSCLMQSKKSRSSEKFDINSIDYVSYLKNKQNRNITIELDDINDLILENGIFITGFENEKATEFGFKNLSIGDRVISINGNFLKNKTLIDANKIIRENSSEKIKLQVEKVSNFNFSLSPSSSMLSLNLDLNNLKFRTNINKLEEGSYFSSNSITSSLINSGNNSKRDNLKTDRIKPLYNYQDLIRDRPESRLFDKIVGGSLRYEDLISNFTKETSKSSLVEQDQPNEIIKKIYL